MTQTQLDAINFKINADVSIVAVHHEKEKSKIKCILSNECVLKPWKNSSVIIVEDGCRRVRLSSNQLFNLYDLKETLLFLTSIVENQ